MAPSHWTACSRSWLPNGLEWAWNGAHFVSGFQYTRKVDLDQCRECKDPQSISMYEWCNYFFIEPLITKVNKSDCIPCIKCSLSALSAPRECRDKCRQRIRLIRRKYRKVDAFHFIVCCKCRASRFIFASRLAKKWRKKSPVVRWKTGQKYRIEFNYVATGAVPSSSDRANAYSSGKYQKINCTEE